MVRSSLFGRRIHISGSVVEDLAMASTYEVQRARAFVSTLVSELIRRGANFVVPVDAEPLRKSDGLPICFDWLIWQSIADNLAHRPADAPGPMAVAVQHHKTEAQIPPAYEAFWDALRISPKVHIESASYWNMASKRMEAQARHGDILIALGGTEGVLFLANLYHDAGKPVVPLDLPLCPSATGARRLSEFGLVGSNSRRLFRMADSENSHNWLNRICFPTRQSEAERVAVLIDLLEKLERPRAFCVRLLNPDDDDFAAVESYFSDVIRPIVEQELGYQLTVIDGQQPYEHARIDQEIFAKLHRSSVVLADITGVRPNCFLELGYAFGRSLPTILMAQRGSVLPFDITTFAGFLWDVADVAACQKAFRKHWLAVRQRPPIVATEPLIQ